MAQALFAGLGNGARSARGDLWQGDGAQLARRASAQAVTFALRKSSRRRSSLAFARFPGDDFDAYREARVRR